MHRVGFRVVLGWLSRHEVNSYKGRFFFLILRSVVLPNLLETGMKSDHNLDEA